MDKISVSGLYKGFAYFDDSGIAVPQLTDSTATRSTIRNPPENTKMKYMPVEEALGRESGASKSSFPVTRKASLPSRPPMNAVSSPSREPVRFRLQSSNFIKKPNPQIGPPGFTKPLNLRSVPSSSTAQNSSSSKGASANAALPMLLQFQQAYRRLWSSVSDKGRLVVQKEVALMESPARTGNAARSGRVSNSAADKESTKFSPRYLLWETSSAKPPLSSLKVPQIDIEKDNRDPGRSSVLVVQGLAAVNSAFGVHANPQPRKAHSEREEPAEVAMKLDRYLPNCPAASPRWKGDFKVHSDDVCCGLVDGIQAHPPCKVHSKVYELAQQLPKSLDFELLPRLKLWSDLFKADAPGGLDIGLYFLPSKRNEQTYACLVKQLDQWDMLLRTHVHGVELLISSSKHLEHNSQRINKKYFLWGVFRDFNDNMVALISTSNAIVLAQSFEAEDLTPVASAVDHLAIVDATEPSKDQAPSNGAEKPPLEEYNDEDMDIDMMGGQDVGMPDLVVKRPKDTVGDPPEGEIRPSDDTPMDKLLRSSPPEVIKVPEHSTISFEYAEQAFNRQLQESFDRFAKMLGIKEAEGVKVEVKAEGETWSQGT
ncbi:hypothetical protein Cgig2_006075 [Carnegiea gigantea]|uniref:AIPP2-like SPOC-like domain-containing protein n=1 Tax=Carnegiea gigantea TaxID=171969 RepID=A0A9Q1KYJ9_9CARY|nr:hypothetical protein Cgig2_006075 [Carnegiea gigantea]